MTDREQKIAKILFVSIFLVIILSIVIIISLWVNFANRNSDNITKHTSEVEIGTFVKSNYTLTDTINKYVSKLNEYFYNVDIDSLYNILSNDYKSYYSYSKENLYSNLKGKNVFGRKFNVSTYINTQIDGKNIYKLVLDSEDLMTSLNINIIETSPNNFVFSLDNFIMKNTTSKEQIINGIKLTTKEITYFNDRIITDAILTNSNDYSILVNFQSANENIYYRIANLDYVTEATVFGGESKIINSNSDLRLVFDIKVDFTTFKNITSLVIKDVKLTPNSSTIELEYKF